MVSQNSQISSIKDESYEKDKAFPHVQMWSDSAAKPFSLTGHKQFYRIPASDKASLRPFQNFI